MTFTFHQKTEQEKKKEEHESLKPSIDELLKMALPVGTEVPNIIITQEIDTGKVPDLLTREVITHLNAAHLIYGKYPPLDKLRKKFPELDSYSAYSLESFFKKVNDTLETIRNCPPYEVKFRKDRVLDPVFVAACNLIIDVNDKRTVAAKCKSVGLSTLKFNNMLKVKKYREFYDNLISELTEHSIYQEGRLALSRNVISGDLPSIKYFNEMTGKYQPNKDFDPRILTFFMTAILDIIVRHVDGNTARVIADELETIAVKELGIGSL